MLFRPLNPKNERRIAEAQFERRVGNFGVPGERPASGVRRQLVFPIVLPHSEMLPENCALFCPESGVGASMKNLSTVRPFCRILNLVGEAEAGSGGDQPAKE